MRLPILIAAEGASWEASLVLALERDDHGVAVVRRCVDIVELLSVAATGQARAALVAADLRRLDSDAIDRLGSADVVAIGVVARDDVESDARLHAIGVRHVVAADAEPRVIAAVIEEAVATEAKSHAGDPNRAGSDPASSARAFSDPGRSTSTVAAPSPEERSQPVRRGSVIAVWGPTGAPGRTTTAVAVADELARLGCATLLVDADVYGGVIGQVLGLLDESAGIAAASRQATTTRLDADALAVLCWQVNPNLRVLTGIPRAQRWPELRIASIASVLSAARGLADFTVVDCGFSLEADEELSFDTVAPRRNGATLAVLDAADLVLIVGAADPVGLQRLVRGLTELRDAEITATSWVVLNKVRRTITSTEPNDEATAALLRFSGRVPAALLPYDQEALDVALAAGKTLAETRPASALRRATVELAAALAGVQAPSPRSHRRRR